MSNLVRSKPSRVGWFWKLAFLSAPMLIMLLAMVEFGTVSLVYLRESGNPYLRVIREGGTWPNPNFQSAYLESAPPARLDKLPQPDRAEELAAHATYLLNESDASILAYAQKYSRAVRIIQDSSSDAPRDFLPQHGMAFASADTWSAQIHSAPESPVWPSPWKATTGRVHFLDASEAVVSLQHSGQKDAGTLLFKDLPFEHAPPESPYLYPFFTFKRHGEAPDGTVYFGLPEFRLNNFGFRDDDSAVPRPRDVFRVACIGASTTMEGATNGFTYPNLAERFLRERFPGRAIEVVNCGIAGINTTSERARLADYLMLDPNAVVILNAVNDICHIHMKEWGERLATVPRMLLHSRFIRDSFNDRFAPDPESMLREFRDRGQGNLLAMADYARRCGVTPYVCTFPHPDGPNLSKEEWVYFERDARLNWTGSLFTFATYLRAMGLWNEQLRALCAEEHVPLIDLATSLTGGGQVFGDICHMKDYGIEQKARHVAVALEPQVAAFFEALDAQAGP